MSGGASGGDRPAGLDLSQVAGLRGFAARLRARAQGRPLWQGAELFAAFAEFGAQGGSPARDRTGAVPAELVERVLEVLILGDRAAFVLRSGVGRTTPVVVPDAEGDARVAGQAELLALYEECFGAPGGRPEGGGPLRLDFLSLYDTTSRVDSVEEIGRGLEVILRRTAERLRAQPEARERALVALLGLPSLKGRRLLIDPDRFAEPGSLAEALGACCRELARLAGDQPAREALTALRGLGLQPGWGDTVTRTLQTLESVQGLLEDPSAQKLEDLLSRLPLVQRVVIVSPHGWFGQENVLGRPDTGGQIVYILDQVQGLESTLEARLKAAGVESIPKVVVLTRQIPRSEGTSCGERLEPIRGTRNGAILRLPFEDERDGVLPHWISRFEVWPYLRGFAERAAAELPAELGGEPDLIVGNYSDGNLVGTLLSARFRCPLATIAHALEKTKYAGADLRWREYEPQYHFSVQLLADLVAMNSADFVVTSTLQEIAGDAHSRGQYEAHRSFTLPGLYRVQDGTDPFLDKFNVVPPGVNEEVFFPHTELERRQPERRRALEELLFTAKGAEIYGFLSEPERVPLLTLARLDRTKNITGLVESFGASAGLRNRCNLLVVAGKIEPGLATDAEERREIERMYELIERHGLEGRIRWLGVHLPKQDTGELYRVVADHRGLFVQPALYEAFGLTVLEAMVSGLPTFATRHGGPAEIIEDQTSGYLIDPKVEGGISGPLISFLEQLQRDSGTWGRLSLAGVRRVRRHFSWRQYSGRILDAAALYGLRRVDWGRGERQRLDAYGHLLLRLLLEPRAQAVTAGRSAE
jgi:sucrose synthase